MGGRITTRDHAALEAVLSTDATGADALRMLFQPVVDLATGALVGHEALARGPRGSTLERPEDLFAAARATGELQRLDWACRCAAFRQAVDRDVPRGWRLFVNAEPQVLGTACPDELVGDWVGAHRRLDVVVEVTERYLMHRPADLVRVLATLRELGWEVALDDAGANDAGVALLPVLQPDVVKLDASLLKEHLGPERRATLRAIADYIERSDALLLAEGIETPAHLARARALGAAWGQGWLFGRPAPLREQSTATTQVVPRAEAGRGFDALSGLRPFDLLGVTTPTVLAPADWLAGQVTSFCDTAAQAPHAGVLLLSLGEPGVVPAGAFRRLDTLSDVCALVAVLAVDPPARRPVTVRVTELAASDPWADQYAAVVIGPRTARALVARRCADGRYETFLSEDPDDVAALARLLLLRLDPVRL